ncbi:MAG: hypothetical protein ACFCD0_08775 [Gemmataceae bacterium]
MASWWCGGEKALDIPVLCAMLEEFPNSSSSPQQKISGETYPTSKCHQTQPTTKLDGTPTVEPKYVVYEVPANSQDTNFAGLLVIQKLAHDVDLINAINEQLHVLKIHNPYHESDYLMTFAQCPCQRKVPASHRQTPTKPRSAIRVGESNPAGSVDRRRLHKAI